jgi:hypothetical protein
LAEAEKRESGAFTVQLLPPPQFAASGLVLNFDFTQYQAAYDQKLSKRLPDGLSVATEHNYTPDANGHLKPVTEYFLHFNTHQDVCYVLAFKTIKAPFSWATGNASHYEIELTKPARDAATRALWRSIGEHIERVKAIDAEFLKMNVDRDNVNGFPQPPKNVLDRSFFLDPKNLPQWESTRAAGGVLGHHAFAYLRSYTPINAATLQARITALYNEQCDALIQLRKHQLAGLEFLF